MDWLQTDGDGWRRGVQILNKMNSCVYLFLVNYLIFFYLVNLVINIFLNKKGLVFTTITRNVYSGKLL